MTKKEVAMLLLANLLYASVSIFSKSASTQEFMSMRFILSVGMMVMMLGIYAVAWQQILKKTELSTAYMFKGSALVFVLMFSAIIFGEEITLCNIIGSALIITGIVVYAKS